MTPKNQSLVMTSIIEEIVEGSAIKKTLVESIVLFLSSIISDVKKITRR